MATCGASTARDSRRSGRNGEVLDPCVGWTWNRHGHYDSHIPEVFPLRDVLDAVRDFADRPLQLFVRRVEVRARCGCRRRDGSPPALRGGPVPCVTSCPFGHVQDHDAAALLRIARRVHAKPGRVRQFDQALRLPHRFRADRGDADLVDDLVAGARAVERGNVGRAVQEAESVARRSGWGRPRTRTAARAPSSRWRRARACPIDRGARTGIRRRVRRRATSPSRRSRNPRSARARSPARCPPIDRGPPPPSRRRRGRAR